MTSCFRAWIVAAAVVLGTAVSSGQAEEPAEQVRRTNFIQIRPTRLYRLIFRRPRDASRFYHLLGHSQPAQFPAASAMPRVKLPAQGAALRWTPGSQARCSPQRGT